MTLKEYRRMCVFALRMVKLQPRRYRKACREHVVELLDRMNCENFSLHYSQVIDWDSSERWTSEEIAADPVHCRYSKNRLICDYVSHEHWEYDRDLTRQKPDAEGCYGTVLRGCVQCCIRAALDVASAPSGGVVGFTVGDLRNMWLPHRLPEWVTNFFEPALAETTPSDSPVWL